MSEWYYAHDGEQKGPVPVSELHRLAANGDFDPVNDLVWREGMSDWKPAGTVPELTPSKPAETAPGASSPESPGTGGPGTEPAPYNPPAASTATPASTTPGPPTGGPPAVGLAIGAMICGILGLIGCCVPYISIPLAIVGVVLGHIAISKANSDPARFGGKGQAKAGLITGYIGIVAGLALAIFSVWLMTRTPEQILEMEFLPPEAREELIKELEKMK